jgi:hypothetical protein
MLSPVSLAQTSPNLRHVEEFCLYVDIQSNDQALPGRSDELRQHILRRAGVIRAPVDDCFLGRTLRKPSIDILVLGLRRGYLVQVRVMIDSPVEVDKQRLTSVIIYSTSDIGTRTEVTYSDILETAQEMFETLIIRWREATGN